MVPGDPEDRLKVRGRIAPRRTLERQMSADTGPTVAAAAAHLLDISTDQGT
jgi:hypothetical protein